MTKKKVQEPVEEPVSDAVADLPVAEEGPGYEVEGDSGGGEGGAGDVATSPAAETITDADPGDETAERSSGTAGLTEAEREVLPEHCIRIEDGPIVEVAPGEVRQYRLTIAGANYEHVGEEVVVGREAIWVYRRM